MKQTWQQSQLMSPQQRFRGHTFAVVLFASSILSTMSLARSCVLKCWKLISWVSGRVRFRIVNARKAMPTPSAMLPDDLVN